MDLNLCSNVRDLADHRDHAERVDASYNSPPKTAGPRFFSAPAGSGGYHDAAIEQARRDAIEARCNPYAGRLAAL